MATIQSLSQSPQVADFLRAFHEEHVIELGFLLFQLECQIQAGAAPEDVVELERRCQAHVEAMRRGGQPALQCARDYLQNEDELFAGAAAHLLCQLGHPG
jgi:hypothetical protein